MAAVAVLGALVALRLVLGYVGASRAAEAAERALSLEVARSAHERQAELASRALDVLGRSLEPAPPAPAELRRLELENVGLERAAAFDVSDPFDDVAAVRPVVASLPDGDESPWGIEGLGLDGRLVGERWEATS